MNRILSIKLNITDKRVILVLTQLVFISAILALTQDFLRAHFKNSAFYFSEAFMFSSFWWLFAPLLFMQYFAVRNKNITQLNFQVAVIILPIIFHLLTFPFLVWVLSKVFYYHTYSFYQTLRYTISEHLYLLALIYSIPALAFQFFTRNKNLAEALTDRKIENLTNQFINTVVVSEGHKKLTVMVSEIVYLSSNSPYINIHLTSKKFLQNETLKSISAKLNPEQFVRVHKSTIVNIAMVASYSTRLNGDYDLTMKNGTQLRLSRNFAANFKDLFTKSHRLTTE